MHPPAFAAVAQMLQCVPHPQTVRDLSGDGTDASIRRLLPPDVQYETDGTALVDCVLCCERLHEMADRLPLLLQCRNALRPGGSLLVTAGTGTRGSHPVSVSDVRRWFRALGLTVVDCFARSDVGDLWACGVRR